MKLTRNDKEVIVGFVLTILGLYLIHSALSIKQEAVFMEGAGAFPLIVTVLFTLFAVAHLVVSLVKGGRPDGGKLAGSFRAMLKNAEFREVMLAIGVVSLYIFVGVTFFGIYLTGAILMLGILWGFVPRMKKVVTLVATGAVIATLYLTFTVLFRLPIY